MIFKILKTQFTYLFGVSLYYFTINAGQFTRFITL